MRGPIIGPSKSAEYSEIVKTRFWGDYSQSIFDNRNRVLRELSDVNTALDKPMTYGAVLQKVLWYLDRVIELPVRMIQED